MAIAEDLPNPDLPRESIAANVPAPERTGGIMASAEDPDWATYRLGDFFHLPEGRKRHGKYPGTVIDEYYKRASVPSDYEVMREVIDDVRSIRGIETPQGDHCVIHLRTGDIIDSSEFSVDETLAKKRYYQIDEKGRYIKAAWNQYAKTMRYYVAVAKKLKKLGIKRLEFSYRLDFTPHPDLDRSRMFGRVGDHQKSAEYVRKITEFFIGESFEVVRYECRDADHDFIYMCNSGFFVPSGGGFSKTIARMVKLNGGTVVSSRR